MGKKKRRTLEDLKESLKPLDRAGPRSRGGTSPESVRKAQATRDRKVQNGEDIPGGKGNTVSPWKKGHTPGRIHGGEAAKTLSKKGAPYRVKEALGKMMYWKIEDIEYIRNHGESNIAEKLAADRILVALQSKSNRADKAWEHIVDRVEGKPHQSHSLEVAKAPDPEQLVQEIESELEGHVQRGELDNLNVDEEEKDQLLLEQKPTDGTS